MTTCTPQYLLSQALIGQFMWHTWKRTALYTGQEVHEKTASRMRNLAGYCLIMDLLEVQKKVIRESAMMRNIPTHCSVTSDVAYDTTLYESTTSSIRVARNMVGRERTGYFGGSRSILHAKVG